MKEFTRRCPFISQSHRRLLRRLNELYAQHTGKTLDQIEKDMDRDRFMSAEEAKAYGIVDNVLAVNSFPKLDHNGAKV